MVEFKNENGTICSKKEKYYNSIKREKKQGLFYNGFCCRRYDILAVFPDIPDNNCIKRFCNEQISETCVGGD